MEQNTARKLLFDNLLKLPHRDYNELVPHFSKAMLDDPDFTSKAMVYLFTTSVIRDQQDTAVIALLSSPAHFGLRDAGKALFGLDFYRTANTTGMKAMPPFRLFRILHYLMGFGRYKGQKAISPRLTRTLMNDYLTFLESHPERFDRVIALNRQEVHDAYVTLHRKPSDRVKAIVFEDNPPEDSIFFAIKQVGREADPMEKARLAMKFKLPYTVASGLLPKKNAAAHVALIDLMSPTEAANSIAWVENSGVLEIPEVKAAFAAKVAMAKDVTSLKHRKSSASKNEAVQQAVSQAREKATSEAKKITKRVLLNIDRSGSMRPAIEVAKEFAAFLGARLESPDLLYMVAFNDMATRIKPRSLALSDVEAACMLIKDNGATCLGVGIQTALADGFEPEVIVTLSDFEENRRPSYLEMASKVDCQHVFIGLGNYKGYAQAYTNSVESKGHAVSFFPYMASGRNDYYLFEQIAAILAGQGKKSLVQAILDIELPYVVK
jgi:hypothetical protein